MLTPFLVDFPHMLQHAVIIDDVIIIGRRVCKRVDVYIITLSCTWQIYALSERLLVFFLAFFVCGEIKACGISRAYCLAVMPTQ